MGRLGRIHADAPLSDEPSHDDSTLARPLAPEEIERGQFVTPLEEFVEWPSYSWGADAAVSPHDRLLRLRILPATGGVPLRVARVCLPYVLVKQPCGQCGTLDVRKCRLALLSHNYARTAWKSLKKADSAATKSV